MGQSLSPGPSPRGIGIMIRKTLLILTGGILLALVDLCGLAGSSQGQEPASQQQSVSSPTMPMMDKMLRHGQISPEAYAKLLDITVKMKGALNRMRGKAEISPEAHNALSTMLTQMQDFLKQMRNQSTISQEDQKKMRDIIGQMQGTVNRLKSNLQMIPEAHTQLMEMMAQMQDTANQMRGEGQIGPEAHTLLTDMMNQMQSMIQECCLIIKMRPQPQPTEQEKK